MDIKEYINKLTDTEFEELCTEYLKIRFKDKNIQVHGTRLKKDGGKDVIGKSKDVPYEIWAECKRHNRSIGLDTISKNVILVISKGINELIFFSTSNITKNALKHISIVAAKHDFSVSFIYGKRLYKELNLLPRFQIDINSLFKTEKDTLEISRFFSLFEDSEQYTEQDPLILQRDNIFYIDLYLTNLYDTVITDINCILPSIPEVRFSISNLHTNFKMLAGSNRVIQIRGEVLNPYKKQYIPEIVIKHKVNSKTNQKKIKIGFVDPTRLIYYPLVGQRPQNFLIQKIFPLLKNNVEMMFQPYLISITGKSGTGKTRLLSEIINEFKNHNIQTLYCDAKKQSGFHILREYLCTCLGLPYGSGNISCTLEDFYDVIRRYYSNKKVSDAIYSFVFLEKTSAEIIYYVKESLIYFSQNLVGGGNLFFALDNLQCLDAESIDILYFLFERLQNHVSNVIFGLGTNIEVLPYETEEKVLDFLEKINEYPKDKYISYTCKELENNDAKALYLHAIQNLNQFEYLTKILLRKSGKRPFDIIMLIQWLYDQEMIEIPTKNLKIPSSREEIEFIFNKIPEKSKKMIWNRYRLQKHKSFSFDANILYFSAFKKLAKSILYFGGEVPVEFINNIEIDDEMQFELNQSLFFKYTEKKPCIIFYHDNIYRFFEKYPAFQNDRQLSLDIINWLNENTWYQSLMRSTTVFDCYIRSMDYQKAVEFGLSAISSEYNKRNFKAIIHIGEQLVTNSSENESSEFASFLTSKNQFQIYYAIANAYRIYQDLSKSIVYFEKAHDILEKDKFLELSNSDIGHFFHNYSNACIASAEYSKALTVLDYYRDNCTKTPFYLFIMNNRYSVVNLALNNIEESMNNIDESLKIAKKYNKKQWLSISYSDKAYIYYRAYEDKKNAIKYFNKAINTHISDEATFNRSSEIQAQQAFTYLLENKLQLAETTVRQALNRALEINGTSMEVKSRNLYGIINFFLGNVEKAMNLWNSNLVISTQRMSKDGMIKTYTNMGATYIFQNNYPKARKVLEQAYELYQKYNVSLMTHKPLIYNLMTTYNYLECTEKRDNLLQDASFPKLLSFYNQIISDLDNIIMNEYWPVQLDNVFFNY